jgi:hypothetical protein
LGTIYCRTFWEPIGKLIELDGNIMGTLGELGGNILKTPKSKKIKTTFNLIKNPRPIKKWKPGIKKSSILQKKKKNPKPNCEGSCKNKKLANIG